MNQSDIRDNHSYGKVGDFLKEEIKPNSIVSIVSAYFTIYAYLHLKSQFESVQKLRFLFGEPTFLDIKPEKGLTRQFNISDSNFVININERLSQKKAAKECAEWIDHKVEVRSMVKPNFLHGKMYHIQQPGGVNKAIIGSSNFTVNGLGLGGSPNIELNMVVDGDRTRKDLLKWFNDLWDDNTGLVTDVKKEVLNSLEQYYTENSPEFVYYLTLFYLFDKFIDKQDEANLLDNSLHLFDSQIWDTLFEFQKDGVKGAINKILHHQGCIIADSVGLGKTYEALAIIKYFENKGNRVLVLCPKNLSANWTIYQASQNHHRNPFKQDRFNYSVLYHTDLGREKGISLANGIDLENFNWSNFDLVVIDESHNFRSNPMEIRRKDGTYTPNRALWLMEKIIKSGCKTKVLMLSATPINTQLKDLRNQIDLITEKNNTALAESAGIQSIDQTLNTAQIVFENWAKKPERKQIDLLSKLDSSFFKLLDTFTIARSRKQIKSFYDMSSIGTFPLRNTPISQLSKIDLKGDFPSYDKLNERILEYQLSLYNPSSFLKTDDETQKKYEYLTKTPVPGFKQGTRETYLIGMMKSNYLKRLESSIESFRISIGSTINKIEKLEDKIKEYKGYRKNIKIDVLTEKEADDLADNTDENPEDWLVGKGLQYDLADIQVDKWQKALEKDRKALISVFDKAKEITPERDAKLKDLKEFIEKKIKTPLNPDNKKVLVFTAFADTADYLYKNLHAWAKQSLGIHTGLVTGNGTKTTLGENKFNEILTNFSPRSKKRNHNTEEEIDLLIGTDCISEGQNLQDCDYVVNYDIHWNPVRLIQRFGRIDRIGSTNKNIQMVNFWPDQDLEKYIKLKGRVEARMTLVNIGSTGDENPIDKDVLTPDLKFRLSQLEHLKNEVLDLEDMDDTISLTDFTLDDFRGELTRYLDKNRKLLENSPLGLYAIVPSPSGEYADQLDLIQLSSKVKNILKPGLVLCLRQKTGIQTQNIERINPLQPYFMVYIKDNGEVHYNYTHAKYILEIYRMLCKDKANPYQKLCDLFNKETQNGADMKPYSILLKKAIEQIVNLYQQRKTKILQSGRKGIIPKIQEQVKELEDFELITWLVIK